MQKTLLCILIVSVLVLAACAGSATTRESNLPTPSPFPTYAYVAPTEPAQLASAATAAAATAQAGGALDPAAVEGGRERYVALECAECHGDTGDGTTTGPSLDNMTLIEDEFIDLMRTGGTLGSAHQYATNRLSTRGGHNLYVYLLALNDEAA